MDQLDRQYSSLRNIISELPTKRELLTSIQFGLRVDLRNLKEKYSLSESKDTILSFYPVLSLLDEIDNIITTQFYVFPSMRNRKGPIFDFFLMDKEPNSLGYFYMLNEVVYVFFDLLAFMIDRLNFST